ncbi:hypothetical protein [Niveibacterium sp. SC-1]|uniref:hypothetical protein n=1 Tax=Niveibacterium sp. SC-1 TaxID=3135646 RepID=UPI00311FF6A1
MVETDHVEVFGLGDHGVAPGGRRILRDCRRRSQRWMRRHEPMIAIVTGFRGAPHSRSGDNMRMFILKTVAARKSCLIIFRRSCAGAALAALVPLAAAQAIDCAATPMPAERHICAHPELLETLLLIERRQTDALAAATEAERAALQGAHSQWLAGRNRCGQTPQSMDDCVRSHLQARLSDLPPPAASQSAP